MRNFLFKSLPLAITAGSLVTASPGCGTSCPEIIRDFKTFEDALETPTRSQAKEPDARLRFPLKAVNRLISELLADRLNRPVALPPLTLPGGVRIPLPALFWALSGVTMDVNAEGRLFAHLNLELRDKSGAIATFAIITRLQTVFEHKAQGLVTGARWTLSPDQIERIEPTMSEGGSGRVAQWLSAQLPPALRFIGDKALVDALLPELLNLAANDGWPTIRDEVLGKEPLIDFAFEIPPAWGIAWMKLHNTPATAREPGAIELAMWPNLTVKAAADSRGASPLDARSEAPQLALSGPLAAHLIAKAQHHGELPSRFATTGKADPDGPWHVRATWQEGRRPFGAHLWRFDESCRRVDLDAELKLAIEADGIAVTVKDARVDGVKGPAFVEAFAWVERLFGAATDLTFRQTADLSLELGEATFHLRPLAIQQNARGLTSTLAIEITR